MQKPPQLLPTKLEEAQAPGIRYRIDGELVPVLHTWLDGPAGPRERRFSAMRAFEAVTQHPRCDEGSPQADGGRYADLPHRGTGFGRDRVFPRRRRPSLSGSPDGGQGGTGSQHQFLAATGNLDYTFNRVKGVSSASHQEGPLWLHGYGDVFEKELAQNEQIDIEPGGWIYRDESVRMDVQMFGLTTGIFGGGGNMIWNRFTGPGRVGVQSMYLHMPTSE